MLSWFKKYFIPHDENGHQPHFLRREVIAVLLFTAIAIEVFYLSGVILVFRVSDFFAAVIPSVLVDLTNEARGDDNAPSLLVSPLLEKAAQAKAEDMARKGYFAHVSPDGTTPWYWFVTGGYTFRYAGENLAINFFDSKDLQSAWMNSPTHRANILQKKFNEMGIGMAKGTFEGKEALFVVELFGTPLAPATLIAQPSLAEKNRELAFEKRIPDPREKRADIKEMSVELEGGYNEAAVKEETHENIIQEKESYQPQSSFFARLVSTPGHIATYIYSSFLLVLAGALLLKIFTKIHIQHPHLIANGLFAFIFIASLVAFNHFIADFFGKVF